MRYFIFFYIAFILSTFTGFSSCEEVSRKGSRKTVSAGESDNPVLSAYDLDNGEKRYLDKQLKEISGLHHIDGDQFIAVQDEQGIIYTINYQSGEITSELRFAGPGDYEDITMDAHYYYVLESGGKIYKVPKKGDGPGISVFNLPGGKNEFESIYLDAEGENLILICKACADNTDKTVSQAYAFNLVREQFNGSPLFMLTNSRLQKIAGQKRDNFRPSAAAIHPIEKKLYVLSSVARTLLICDLQGNIENQFRLNPGLYKQPEGIAFTPNGDLYISNEAAGDRANIVKIGYESK